MKALSFKNKPYLIEKKDCNTIDFVILFPYKYDKKDMYNIVLLKQLLANTSFDYKTEQDFKKQLLKNMIIDYSVRNLTLNNNLYLEFDLTVPNPKKVKSFNLDKAVTFFINTIYKPNIKNEAFCEKQFNREKDYIKENIQNSLKNIYKYAYQQFINICDDQEVLKNNIYNNLDLLDKTNAKDLYKYYTKLVTNNEPICFIYGDINYNDLENLGNKYFKKDNKEIIVNKDYNAFLIPSEKIKEKEEVKDYNQSALYMGYKIKNMTEEDQINMFVLCDIIDGSENDLIFKALRIENNLVYTERVNSYSRNGLIFIEAYLNKDSKEKAIKAVKDVFKSLNNKELIKKYINKILVGMKYDLIRQKDSKYARLSNYINQTLETGYSLEELYNYYKNLDIDKFLDFLKRVKLDTIYFLRGEIDEK